MTENHNPQVLQHSRLQNAFVFRDPSDLDPLHLLLLLHGSNPTASATRVCPTCLLPVPESNAIHNTRQRKNVRKINNKYV